MVVDGGVFLSVCAILGLATSLNPHPRNWMVKVNFVVGVQMLKHPIRRHLKS